MPHEGDLPRATEPQRPHGPSTFSPMRRRVALIGVAALASAWICFLVGLTVFTSNPVTVNFQQVQAAGSVVHLRVESIADGRCEVIKTLYGAQLAGGVRIANLDETSAQRGREYIVPLSARGDGEFEVTSLRPSKEFPEGIRPFIYPAKSEAIAQLSAAVSHRRLPR